MRNEQGRSKAGSRAEVPGTGSPPGYNEHFSIPGHNEDDPGTPGEWMQYKRGD